MGHLPARSGGLVDEDSNQVNMMVLCAQSLSTIRLILLAFVCFQTQVAASGKPNVIIVMTDDQGYGDLSCHGNPTLKTPNLDRLYAESVRFTDFHVSPFCTPTRAALMTPRRSRPAPPPAASNWPQSCKN